MTENVNDKKSCGRIADYLPLIQAADGLTLSQVCSLSGLEPSTIQNWIKRGYVPHPVGKKYRERHLARILLIAGLREGMQIDRVGALLRYINGDADDTSDDIITEEALYDLFHEMTEQLDLGALTPDRTGEAADRLIGLTAENRDRIRRALRIMANAYTAYRYKQETEKLFNAYIRE